MARHCGAGECCSMIRGPVWFGGGSITVGPGGAVQRERQRRHRPYRLLPDGADEAGRGAPLRLGITNGCSAGPPPLYCPNKTVSRVEMAAFIARAWRLPPAALSRASVRPRPVLSSARRPHREGCRCAHQESTARHQGQPPWHWRAPPTRGRAAGGGHRGQNRGRTPGFRRLSRRGGRSGGG